ncbi:MAG TPA: YkoF family thiamine/hydroxymethylpyrimidine-binding protein [Pseudomonadales bacterium]
MMLTVEISMYPFNEDYKRPILGFIEKLNTYAGLRVQTSATSTLVVGEHEQVMSVLTQLLAWSHAQFGKAVYVVKFIPGFEPD